MAQRVLSKKRQVVAQGIFKAELNDFFQQELCENGYSGCDVNQLPTKKQIVVRATNTKEVVGQHGRRINELTALVCKRFGLAENKVEIFAEAVPMRGLCAIAQAENLKFKLIQGLAARRAAYSVLRQVMTSGAKGCEVVISGKLRAARAKSMKFTDGFMIHSGQPTRDYIDVAVRHVMLRQGVLGVKVKIMLDHDPEGRRGPNKPLPDHVVIHDPKDEAMPDEIPSIVNARKTAEDNVREQKNLHEQQQQQQQQQQQEPQFAEQNANNNIYGEQQFRGDGQHVEIARQMENNA